MWLHQARNLHKIYIQLESPSPYILSDHNILSTTKMSVCKTKLKCHVNIGFVYNEACDEKTVWMAVIMEQPSLNVHCDDKLKDRHKMCVPSATVQHGIIYCYHSVTPDCVTNKVVKLSLNTMAITNAECVPWFRLAIIMIRSRHVYICRFCDMLQCIVM